MIIRKCSPAENPFNLNGNLRLNLYLSQNVIPFHATHIRTRIHVENDDETRAFLTLVWFVFVALALVLVFGIHMGAQIRTSSALCPICWQHCAWNCPNSSLINSRWPHHCSTRINRSFYPHIFIVKFYYTMFVSLFLQIVFRLHDKSLDFDFDTITGKIGSFFLTNLGFD